ncbi:Nn.00g105050.m01.CDS01 [Neocucurbitaria sp. VM-36]
MNSIPAFPHDPSQSRSRKGKYVPVTTWHWVPVSDAVEDFQPGHTPPTASVDYARSLITPVTLQQAHAHATHVPHCNAISTPSDVYQYGDNAGPSNSALFNLAIAQAHEQAQYRPLSQPDIIKLPDYSQAFDTLPTSAVPFENYCDFTATYQADKSILPLRDSSNAAAQPLPTWPLNIDSVWAQGIGTSGLGQNPSIRPIAPFKDSPGLYSDIVDTLIANLEEKGNASDATDEQSTHESVSPLSQSVPATKNVPPQTTLPSPELAILSSYENPSNDIPGRNLRKRARSPGAVKSEGIIQTEGGKVQGMTSVWQGQKPPDRKLDDAEKADRKRRKESGTCSRCRRLKQPCIGFKESLYLPCESCRTSNPTRITTTCVLEANLLGIFLFRMGPPVDNPFHPLNFFSPHRQDIFYDVTKGNNASDTVELELMQDDVGQVLNLTVSKFTPLLGDKLAYEGIGEDGPYKLDMLPYCISDSNKARQSLVVYMRKAKSAYFNRFVDRSNALLLNTFKMAAMCDFTKRPLVNKALDIWAATRLIERTWKLCGDETLGIHPFNNRSDPWKGFVPVTPIMDQQLDQVVIREILVPRKIQLLNQLKEKVYTEDNRKLHAFEVYMTFFILINNAEVQIAAEREFAQRYGFSGRFGPRGKYMDAEAQFHAARTMLGHFHYICRANSLLTTSPKLLGEFGVSDKEREYLEFVRKQTESQKPYFNKLIREHQYETTMYFCHQMLFNEWNPGHGHIEELPEMTVGQVMAAA